jgi:hypothetical protein
LWKILNFIFDDEQNTRAAYLAGEVEQKIFGYSLKKRLKLLHIQ